MKMVNRALVAVFLGLVVGFFFMPSANADGCRRVVTVTSPTVATGYVPHASYASHAQKIVLVPDVQAVAVNPDFYFSVGDEYRQLALAKLIAQEYAKLQVPVPSPQAPLAPAPIQTQPLIVQPTIPPANVTANDRPECKPVKTALPNGFKEMVKADCAGCHSSGKGKAYLDLSVLDGLDSLPMATRDRMFRSVANGRMPKGHAPIAQEKLDAFNAYAALAEQAVYGSAPVMEPAKK